MKTKLYYLKWDIDTKSFLLDVSFRESDFVYGIKKELVTQDQANEFADLMEKRYTAKGKELNLTFLEYEFGKFFHVCVDCGTATTHTEWVVRQRNWCYECYHGHLSEMYSIRSKEVMERERIKRMKEYIKTKQGKADILGAKGIKANIIVQLKIHSKTQKDLAERLKMTEGNVSELLNRRKSIKIEYLYAIAEWLLVPIDLLIIAIRGTFTYF